MPAGMRGPAIEGLMNQVPMPGMDAAAQGPGLSPNADPALLVEQAISLHKGHMDGSVPTDEQSQQQLMDLLQQIAAAIGGGLEVPY